MKISRMSYWDLVRCVKDFVNTCVTHCDAEKCALVILDDWAKRSVGKIAMEKQSYKIKLKPEEIHAFRWAFGYFDAGNVWLFSTVQKLLS